LRRTELIRRQEAGGRRQEAGGRRQEAGGRRQEAGGRRQEAGGRKFLSLAIKIGIFVISNKNTVTFDT